MSRSRKTTEDVFRIDTQYCNHDLTNEEQSACINVIEKSQHVSIQLLPNHHINRENELQGFVFSCAENEMSDVIPFPKNMFAMTALYEVLPCSNRESEQDEFDNEITPAEEVNYDDFFDNAESCVASAKNVDYETISAMYTEQKHHYSQRHEIANPDFIRIINDSANYKNMFTSWLKSLHENSDTEPLFECIPTDVDTDSNFNFETSEHDDRRAWSESVPCKVGLYHAHMPSQTRDHSKHRLFIVVSGACRRASEDMYNLWTDFRSQLTCRDLLECEEMQWLRETTIRNHGRIAAKFAEILGVNVSCMPDMKDPEQKAMCLPESVSYIQNCKLINNRVFFSNNATFVEDADNGILVDIFANEGFWAFNGRPDPSGNNIFGHSFDFKSATCLPTTTIRYHDNYRPLSSERIATVDTGQFPINISYGMSCLLSQNQSTTHIDTVFDNQIPDEKFMQTMSRLSFERDHGCVHLLPVMSFCEK